MMIDPMKFRDVDPGFRVLMGPGPSDVSTRVLQAMAAPCIGHLDPYFLEVMDEAQKLLRYLFKADYPLTIPVSGTGSAGMEACFVNLIEPGDKVFVCVNGVFGARMCDIVTRIGGELIRLDFPWGRAVDPEEVRKKAKETNPDVLAVVHAETSTGACSSLAELSQVAQEVDALFLVDMVTSLGGMPVNVEENKIDAAYSGTQKCISCPPGLSPVTLSPKAVDKLNSREVPVVSWYLDMGMVASYWGKERKYHHTAPVNMIYALREALRTIAEEGMESRFERHEKNHLALVAGLESMGLTMLVPEKERLPMLNTVNIPEGVNDIQVRSALLKDYNIEIGAGLGDLAGKVWRVGLMGTSCTRRNVVLFLGALHTILKGMGAKIKPGALEAADEIYNNGSSPN
ncbi:alanine--glyoxylate aminotransferase family protein [Deltaproteobacteria bacterium]|nr:alanine--glyoxylate aminotransferase family protein [Deltaproteobacteria bacterium]